MSIITKIDSLPLFTKKAEALKYARLNGLSGYHKHTHFGKIGYMAGRTHSEVSRANTFITKITADISTLKQQQGIYTIDTTLVEETETPLEQIIPQPDIIETTTATTSYSGGGGGGGY